MATIPVIVDPNSKFDLHSPDVPRVDFSEERWRSLRREHIRPFKVEELIRKCRAYPDGIFPGCAKITSDKQIFEVANFLNWIEFSQVMEEDIVLINGKKKLTTRYYDQRKLGWSSSEILKKSGKLIGYCVSGDIYHKDDKNKVFDILYRSGYLILIQSQPAFLELQKYIINKQNFVLTGDDSEFLEKLASLLTSPD